MQFGIYFELSIACGFLLDLLLADPAWMPHPVVIIGRGITFLENHLRRIFRKTPRGERAAGRLMAVLISLTTWVITMGLCVAAWVIHPILFFLLHTLWCWQAIAVAGLAREARNVYDCFASDATSEGNLVNARKAVSRIVGRDTEHLDEAGVLRAAVETVAENFSDGVMAPLLYMMIGGAPLALTYKAVNTMDSMVGYRNDRYLDFGRGPAHLDDVCGFIPARIGALLWILSAGITGQNMGEAYRIWRRDRRNHASPNAAQTESACAGALGVQLAGPAYYFGERYDKPSLGDAHRPIEPQDILRTNRMLYAASGLAWLLCLGVSTGWMLLVTMCV